MQLFRKDITIDAAVGFAAASEFSLCTAVPVATQCSDIEAVRKLGDRTYKGDGSGFAKFAFCVHRNQPCTPKAKRAQRPRMKNKRLGH